MNLSKLTDKELIELQKQILEEKENRKDNLLYKSNISITEEQYDELINYFTMIFHKKDFRCSDRTAFEMIESQIAKIRETLYVFCDLIYGNFECQKRDQEYRSTKKVVRNTARLLIDDKEGYRDMYQELYSVIEKHMKKRKEKLNG